MSVLALEGTACNSVGQSDEACIVAGRRAPAAAWPRAAAWTATAPWTATRGMRGAAPGRQPFVPTLPCAAPAAHPQPYPVRHLVRSRTSQAPARVG